MAVSMAVTALSRAKTAENRLREARATAELKVLELASRPLYESWPVVVPQHEYPGYDDFGMGPQASRGQLYSTVDDRTEGRWRPLYDNAFDLARMRAGWRELAEYTSTAVGAVEALGNYVLGTGYTFTVQSTSGEDGSNVMAGIREDANVKKAQRVIDQFLEDNEFVGDLDREIHDRSRTDGEVFIRLIPDGWRTRACLIEPEQIVEPQSPRELEDWLGTGEEVNYWHHGIHTLWDRQVGHGDPTRPRGYHVIHDQNGDEWDYVSADQMLHIKRNVSRNAWRGVSDFLSITRDLQLIEKIRRNTGEGAAIQAAIAFIREHAPGVTGSSITAMVQGGSTTNYDKPVKDSSRTTYSEQLQPGTVKDIPQGMKYHAGPLGMLRSAVYVEVEQNIIRASIGVRWQMPEYMIAGDASNANYASALVSESPFVKARENDQAFYSRKFDQMLWMVIHIAWKAGYFGSADWQQLKASVSLKIDPPDVASRDTMKQAQTNAIEQQAGVLSTRTWANEAGRDYEEEVKNGAKPMAPQIGQPGAVFESDGQRRQLIREALMEGYP